MEEKKNVSPVADDSSVSPAEDTASSENNVLSETWAQDALQDLDDFIESQGIYIRQ